LWGEVERGVREGEVGKDFIVDLEPELGKSQLGRK
jgi:hypothetical protein